MNPLATYNKFHVRTRTVNTPSSIRLAETTKTSLLMSLAMNRESVRPSRYFRFQCHSLNARMSF